MSLPRSATEAATIDIISAKDALIRRLTARVEELERAQAWQPIETAPRDGRDILVKISSGSRVAYFERDHSIFGDFWFVPSTNMREVGQILRDCPTHWMPLPPAPTEARSALEAANKGEE